MLAIREVHDLAARNKSCGSSRRMKMDRYCSWHLALQKHFPTGYFVILHCYERKSSTEAWDCHWSQSPVLHEKSPLTSKRDLKQKYTYTNRITPFIFLSWALSWDLCPPFSSVSYSVPHWSLSFWLLRPSPLYSMPHGSTCFTARVCVSFSLAQIRYN